MLTVGRFSLITLVLAGLTLPALAQESPFQCETRMENGLIRHMCAPQDLSSDIKILLPDVLPPVVIGNADGVALGAGSSPVFGLAVDPPEPPPTTIVIAPQDLFIPDEMVASAIFSAPRIDTVPESFVQSFSLQPTAAQPTAIQPLPAPIVTETKVAFPADILKSALQRLATAKRLGQADSAALLAFYESRAFQPLWLENGQWNQQAKAARAKLSTAADDGMEPARYPSVSAFHTPGEPQWVALATAEIQLTESLLLYAREATIGRVAPRLVHPLITPRLNPPTVATVMATLAATQDIAVALQGFQPSHAGYQQLRQKLAGLRVEQAPPSVEYFPDGPPLRVGMRDPRVPLIRAKLGMGYDSGMVYDRVVSIKVAGLQKAAGLPITGAFTPQTRRIMTGEAPSPEEAEIIANMERWRWLPRDLGRNHIAVNVPQLRLQMIRNGEPVYDARVIVGKDETQTPIFSDMIDHIVVNPSWFVPPGILKKDPRYLDPAWAEARGYTLTKRGENVTVRVPPSASNALGYVKFMFPNEHAVYLHDTPSRGLFNARTRTLSNGCVRVENPFRLAALMFENEGWTEQRFKKMIGADERMMKLAKKLPVHLTYFTVTVEPDGVLTKHPDIYGHSARLRQLLSAP